MAGEIIAALAFLSATVFGLAGLYGLFTRKDPYGRVQSGALTSTTAVLSLFIGLLALSPDSRFLTRIIVIIAFFLISSPTATYIVTRLYWKSQINSQETP